MTPEERRKSRAERRISVDPVTRGIFDVIDEFDDEPSKRGVLRESYRAAPDRFRVPAVIDSLFELAELQDFSRSPTALSILDELDIEGERVLHIALASFSRGRGSDEAGQVVIRRVRETHADLVKPAVHGLASLAIPISLGFPGGRPADARPLQVAYTRLPGVVISGLADTLRRGDSYRRRVAAEAAGLLFACGQVRDAPDQLVEELLRSAVRESGNFFESRSDSPSAAAAKALGEALKRDPEKVDARIHRHMQLATQGDQAALLDAYLAVLERIPEPSPRPVSDAERIAFARLMAVIVERRSGPAFDRALELLRYRGLHFPDLLADHADALLGTVALLTEDIDRIAVQPVPEPGKRVDPVEALSHRLNTDTQIITLDGARSAVIEAVGAAAASRPTRVLPGLLRTVHGLREDQRDLYVALLHALGTAGTSRDGLPLVLPTLYTALMHRASDVRIAGAQAYGKIARSAAADLPSLFHEAFLVQLTDPQVGVHAAALDALRSVDLPNDVQTVALGRLAHLVLAYSLNPINDAVWAAAIERYFEVAASVDALVPETADAVLRQIPRMGADVASRTLRRLGWRARDFTAFPEVAIQIFSEPRLDSHGADDLLDELQRLSAQQLADITPQLRLAALAELAKGRSYRGEPFTELLVRVHAWADALAVAEATLAATGPADLLDMRLEGLHAEARLIAAGMEEAISAGRLEDLPELVRKWNGLSPKARAA